MKHLVKKIFHVLGFDIVTKKHSPITTSKRSDKLTFHSTKTGNYYLPTDAVNDIVANTIIDNRIFEQEVVDLASKYIKPNTAVLDVGSNFGQMSILFSNLVGDQGKVYAFDADDWIFEILEKNIDANNKRGIIKPHFGAVHKVDGDVLYFPLQDFDKFQAYGSYGIDYNATRGREVKSFTIDSLNIQEPISFMKIDIQGGDLQAMQGAVKTIARNKMPILFEYEYHFEEDYNLCFQDYIDFVQSIGYKFHKNINGHNYLIIPR
jgi:FkbM family methyltransferase